MRWFPTMQFLLPYLLFHLLHASLAARDVTAQPQVTTESVTTPVEPAVQRLQAEVKKLRKSFIRLKNGRPRGKK